jgi:Spy/CpxP family protein refolding chaperone
MLDPKEDFMNRLYALFFASAVLALSIVSDVGGPNVVYADAAASDKGAEAQRSKMPRAFAHEAPLISIALKHKAELNLTADQVSSLEKTRTDYQNHAAPLQEQLRGIESEIATLLQESPANLIQVRLKIEEAEKLRSELRYLRVEALENGKSVLSGQQKDQLKSLLASSHRGFRRPHQGQPS